MKAEKYESPTIQLINIAPDESLMYGIDDPLNELAPSYGTGDQDYSGENSGDN